MNEGSVRYADARMSTLDSSTASCALRARDAGTCPTRCDECGLKRICLPADLNGENLSAFADLTTVHRRIKREKRLYKQGDACASLYAVRRGFFKAVAVFADGRERVTGFQMTGDIIGTDGLPTGMHVLNLIALEDSEVCVIPYAAFEEMARRMPTLQHQFHRILSKEIIVAQNTMMLIGCMQADERVAAFLLSHSHLFVQRGYAAAEFNLRMTRKDLGSYLGMNLETVSRVFSRFHQGGLITVHQKHMQICDVKGLERIADSVQ